MNTSPNTLTDTPPAGDDHVSVLRWFAFFALIWLGGLGVLIALLMREQIGWGGSWGEFLETVERTPAVVKLLVFGLYVALCCTFLPLPTGPVVALVSLQSSAVGSNIVTTTLLVAVIGAFASTLANLNDYHAFTLMLRYHRVARVRETGLYRKTARWFHKSPFGIIVVFNIIPIPVDVIRMLATTVRYPRLPFAAANFIGRLVRYGVIAAVTYALGEKYGWLSVVVLLGVAVGLMLYRTVPSVVRRLGRTHRAEIEETS